MSSLFNDGSEDQHSYGFHFARIMAFTIDLPADRAEKVRESARALIGAIPAADEIAEMYVHIHKFVAFLKDNPQLIHGYPGGCYWPLRALTDELDAAGIPNGTFHKGGVA